MASLEGNDVSESIFVFMSNIMVSMVNSIAVSIDIITRI